MVLRTSLIQGSVRAHYVVPTDVNYTGGGMFPSVPRTGAILADRGVSFFLSLRSLWYL